MLNRASKLKKNRESIFYAEMCDIAMIPACKVEYQEKLRGMYLSRLEEKSSSDETALDATNPMAKALVGSMLQQLRKSTGHG